MNESVADDKSTKCPACDEDLNALGECENAECIESPDYDEDEDEDTDEDDE